MNNKKEDGFKCLIPEENCEILFPDTYQTKSQSILPNSGTTIYFSKDWQGKGFFQIGITHLVSDYFGGLEDFLDSALEMIIKDISHFGEITIVKREFINFQDHLALKYRLNISNNVITNGNGIIFVVGKNKLFALETYGIKNIEDYINFVNSFKFI